MLVSLTAADLLRYITWAIFLAIGLWVVGVAIRRPTPVNIDVAVLFGGLATAIVLNGLVQFGYLERSQLITWVATIAVLAMPFLLVRLMDDIIGVPPRLMRVFMVAFALYVAGLPLLPAAVLAALSIPLVLGLLATLIYVVVIGLRAVRQTKGITRRRLIAVSLGSLFLALNFGAGRLPIDPEDARSLVDVFGVAAGLSYYFGFVPPRWLRQIWQGPELRDFLARTAGLPQLEDRDAMLRILEAGAAGAIGAPHGSIALWDQEARGLRFPTGASSLVFAEDSPVPAARSFQLQAPLFSRDAQYDAELDEQFQLRTVARVVLSAPITLRGQRMGVLSVYGPRVSLFVEDDLALLQLLADQTAVVLESRRLGEQASRIRAREEAARLKEDFLSTAAHDLKTPLTTLVLQAQFAARQAARNPQAPADPQGLSRIVAESERLRAMVHELLDAVRAEQAQLIGQRRPVDLAASARAIARRYEDDRHPFVVVAEEPLVGSYDPHRIDQLLENLAENAVKYSPLGGAVTITIRRDDRHVHLTVADQGIGIPADDLPHVFERFHRGVNVDDRSFPGWGLGLSICRRIVEQHGGQISVSSREGEGSTFSVTLPNAPVLENAHVVPHLDR